MMCLRQDVINRKNLLKLKLNSIWNKIHKLLPPKVDLKPLLGGPLAIGLRSWKYNVSPGYQLRISSLQHTFI